MKKAIKTVVILLVLIMLMSGCTPVSQAQFGYETIEDLIEDRAMEYSEDEIPDYEVLDIADFDNGYYQVSVVIDNISSMMTIEYKNEKYYYANVGMQRNVFSVGTYFFFHLDRGTIVLVIEEDETSEKISDGKNEYLKFNYRGNSFIHFYEEKIESITIYIDDIEYHIGKEKIETKQD